MTIAVTKAKDNVGNCKEFVGVNDSLRGWNATNKARALWLKSYKHLQGLVFGRNAQLFGGPTLGSYEAGIRGYAETNLYRGLNGQVSAMGLTKIPCADCQLFFDNLPTPVLVRYA
jgi:hypothetical protein